MPELQLSQITDRIRMTLKNVLEVKKITFLFSVYMFKVILSF